MWMNVMLKKFHVILFILSLLILPLIIIYYKGKLFYSCKNNNEKIYIVNVQMPPQKYINELENILRNNGTVLNPKLNFNNAKGKN